MRAYTKICLFRSKHHERTIRTGRFCANARGLFGREVNPICPANAWRKFRWTRTPNKDKAIDAVNKRQDANKDVMIEDVDREIDSIHKYKDYVGHC